jgi:hypothetical protein
MSLIAAGSISLDSTFNRILLWSVFAILKSVTEHVDEKNHLQYVPFKDNWSLDPCTPLLRIRIRIHVFLGLPDPDPDPALDPDPDLFIFEKCLC